MEGQRREDGKEKVKKIFKVFYGKTFNIAKAPLNFTFQIQLYYFYNVISGLL